MSTFRIGLTSDNTGRKEITTFFYSYFLLTICSLLLDCGVIPIGGSAYPYFTAIQSGLTSATCICLMINGFVGFQLYEDGTTLSVWLLRVCSFTMFIITFAVSLLTFKGWAGLGPTNTIGLFVVLYILNAIFIFVYVAMQVLLVLGTLQDRWPLGNIAFGVFFFVVGQIILYVFSEPVCEGISHYMDGLFFATVCNLLGVMMVYKVSKLSKPIIPPSPLIFSLPSSSFLSYKTLITPPTVLGLHHKRRPRIQRRHQTKQLGPQGPESLRR